jgi:hypothetical protein
MELGKGKGRYGNGDYLFIYLFIVFRERGERGERENIITRTKKSVLRTITRDYMAKTVRTITIDTEVDIAIRRSQGFNVSQFCNESLRTALNVKDIQLSEEEHLLSTDIAEERIKLQMMEKKLEELVCKRKKEAEQWVPYQLKKG